MASLLLAVLLSTKVPVPEIRDLLQVYPVWATRSIDWEKIAGGGEPRVRTGGAKVLYFGADGKFGIIACYLIKQGRSLNISHGDGQDVYMGRWTYHDGVVSIRYRLVSVTVESVPPQKLPGPLQEGTVKAYGDRTLTDQKRAKPLIVFDNVAFQPAPKLDVRDVLTYFPNGR